jgi:hypothetical protein
MTFDLWLAHFRTNDARNRKREAMIPWDNPSQLDVKARTAFIHSFQRFELGESGDGKHLLAKASLQGDEVYLSALELLAREEQAHSELFRRGLVHLGAHSLDSHWSDKVFTFLRRMMGLRTELALFLIAETVAMGYFTALSQHAPDPVLRGIGKRIASDERNHIRFQIDRLRQGFEATSVVGRTLTGLGWGFIACGATTVIILDHGSALRTCGLSPIRYFAQAMREFRQAAESVLGRPAGQPLGPLG